MKAIIVLGAGIRKNGELDYVSKSRVVKAVQLMKNDGYFFIMSGKYSFILSYVPKYTEAKAMKMYAIQLGIPARSIILEEKSKDTLGNLYFCKEILKKKKCSDIIIVSSRYHKERTEYVAKKVFGDSYKTRIVTTKDNLRGLKGKLFQVKEQVLFSLYKRYLDGIKEGNDIAIRAFILTRHPGYKD